jgi:hypothetical protein
MAGFPAVEANVRGLLKAPGVSRAALDRADKLTAQQQLLLSDLRGPVSGRHYAEIRSRLAAISAEISMLLPDVEQHRAS